MSQQLKSLTLRVLQLYELHIYRIKNSPAVIKSQRYPASFISPTIPRHRYSKWDHRNRLITKIKTTFKSGILHFDNVHIAHIRPVNDVTYKQTVLLYTRLQVSGLLKSDHHGLLDRLVALVLTHHCVED